MACLHVAAKIEPTNAIHVTSLHFFMIELFFVFLFFLQYFENKFKCPAGSNSTVHCRGFDRDFENFFSVAAMLPIIIMGVVNVWLQSK